MKYQRLIVCGDSYSEGMSDEMVNGQYRGWADRIADVMAKEAPGFTYVNLAVRGKLLKQVIDDQLPVAIKYVTGPETLLTFHAGANDALRPGYKPEVAQSLYAEAVRRAAATGATLMLFTVLERTGNTGRGSDVWAARFGEFNKIVRKVGAEVGAIIVDANNETFFSDNRFLAFDRLHLNAEGHNRVAQALLEKLGYPFNPSWRVPLPPAEPTPWLKKRLISAIWFFGFALPWIWRRLRGKSSGDGRVAKYPTPTKWRV
ncbi:SGNH/GDSL hydrolase family protein [Actinobacteria bacterium IMCC26103]|nr:SGNH/GDSL hydrolase family protein [Actinobacteria bacterium IMCC26103]